jgi:hypothetical protein
MLPNMTAKTSAIRRNSRDGWVSTSRAAVYADVTPSTIREWIRLGRLPAYRINARGDPGSAVGCRRRSHANHPEGCGVTGSLTPAERQAAMDRAETPPELRLSVDAFLARCRRMTPAERDRIAALLLGGRRGAA